MQVDKSNQESPLGGLIDQYSEVLEEGLGTFKGPKVKIHIDPEARPKFLKALPVPYAMTGKIVVELKRLQEEGTKRAAPLYPETRRFNSHLRRLQINRQSSVEVEQLSYPEGWRSPSKQGPRWYQSCDWRGYPV